MSAGWLDEIPVRPLAEGEIEARISMSPGDQPLVEAGDQVAPGDPLVARLRDGRVEEVDVRGGGATVPIAGSPWRTAPAAKGTRDAAEDGELLTSLPGRAGRWRIVTGEHRDTIVAVAAGVVSMVRPGAEIRLRLAGRAVRGAFAAGQASRGRLELATDPFGELRAGAIDVGRTGTILVVGSRIDAEALTRARAMGVSGIVVASLAGKDLRDFQASERRQRAALHQAVPFSVLVLDGAVRRPLATPLAALLAKLAGREASIITDPPALVFDAPDVALPAVDEDWVRARSGQHAGAEGKVLALGGMRRFAAGVHLESARVAFEDEAPVEVPISDLERMG